MQENKKSVDASAGTADVNTNSIKTDNSLALSREFVNKAIKIDNVVCDLECSLDLVDSFISLYEHEGDLTKEEFDVVKSKAYMYVENLKKYISILYAARKKLEINMHELAEISSVLMKGANV